MSLSGFEVVGCLRNARQVAITLVATVRRSISRPVRGAVRAVQAQGANFVLRTPGHLDALGGGERDDIHNSKSRTTSLRCLLLLTDVTLDSEKQENRLRSTGAPSRLTFGYVTSFLRLRFTTQVLWSLPNLLPPTTATGYKPRRSACAW